MNGTFALVLLASCGGQSEQEPARVEISVAANLPQQGADPTPVAWDACKTPTYDSTGNRWWGGFTACEGDVRLDIEADSILLHGPDLRVTIRTPSCPAGQGAGGGSLDRAFFERSFEAQLGEVKRIVRQSLAEIDEECGGPTQAPALLGQKFDEEFLDLARYWLDLSAADRRKAWAAGR